VVGEVFVRWLANTTDKTEHAAGEHAHFLTLNALHLLTCRRSHRKGANHARPYSDADGEVVMRHVGPAEEDDLEEDAMIARLDALAALRRRDRGRPAASMSEALAVLRARGWSVLQVALAAGVSEAAVHNWTNGVRRPTPASIATVIRLATTDGPPPAHERRPRVALPVVAPSVEEVRDALASLLRRHTYVSLARQLGVSRQAVDGWATGARFPRAEHAAALASLARQACCP